MIQAEVLSPRRVDLPFVAEVSASGEILELSPPRGTAAGSMLWCLPEFAGQEDADAWVRGRLEEATAQGVARGELSVSTVDGRLRHMELTFTRVVAKDASARILCSALDVTERRQGIEERQQTAERLAVSESLLREAQAIAKLGSWELDLVTGQLTWSDEIFRIFGLPREHFQASYEGFLHAVHPDDREAVNAAYSRSVEERQPYSIVHRLLVDGRVKWVHELGRTDYDAMGRPRRSMGTVQDVTERVEAEERVRRSERVARTSEERLRTIVEAAPDCIKLIDASGRVLDMNPAGVALLKMSGVNDVIGMRAEEAVVAEDRQSVRAALSMAMRGYPSVVRYRVTDALGGTRWIEQHAVPIPAPEGSPDPTAMLAIARDITETHDATERLRLSEERLLRTEAHASIGSWELNLRSMRITGSPEFFRIAGMRWQADADARASWGWIAEADRPRVSAWITSLSEGHDLPPIEYQVLRPDNSTRWVRGAGRRVVLGDGSPGIQGYQHDITEQRRTLEELHLKDAALESATNGVVILSVDGRIAYANPAFALLCGCDARELVGSRAIDLVVDRGRFTSGITRLLRQGQVRDEAVILSRTGRRVTLDVIGSVVRRGDGQVHFLTASVVDVTERRLVENLQHALATQLVRLTGRAYYDAVCEHLRRVLEVENVFMTMKVSGGEPGGRVVGWAGSEDRPERWFFDAPGPQPAGVVVPEDQQVLVEILSGRGERIGYLGASSQRPLWCRRAAQNLLRIAAISAGAEWERRRAEARFEKLFEAGNDAVLFVDEHNEVIEANTTAAVLLGRGAGALVGEALVRLLPGLPALVGGDRQSGRKGGGDASRATAVRADGTEVPVMLRMTPLEIEGESLTAVIMQDWTTFEASREERQALKAQLLHLQKMDAIGVLAAGIAHDFNNILTGINGFAELATLELGNGEAVTQALREIRRASRRAADLVHQILTFSRRDQGRWVPVDPGALVQEISHFLRATIPAGVELTARVAPGVPSIEADPSQLHQILLNLGTNAWHALGGQAGHIEIRVDVVAVHAGEVPELVPGEYVRFAVIDDGAGMDARTLERAMEPFFTTKEPGQGSGLGLALVHGIARGHGGSLQLVSARGEGTTARVYLPVRITEDVAPPAPLPVGDEVGRVLLIDDEEFLVAMESQMLAQRGHTVTTFTDAEQALRAIRRDPGAFDVVVTDLNMPGWPGTAVAEQLLELAPQVPVIVASGYFDASGLMRDPPANVHRLLRKPFGMEEFAGAVAVALSERRSGRGAPVAGR